MKNQSSLSNAATLALSASAIALLAAILFVRPSSAPAEEAVVGREYQAVTAKVQNGSEALYLLDNRTGVVGIFVYEPAAKGLVFKGRAPIADAFAPPVGGAPGAGPR